MGRKQIRQKQILNIILESGRIPSTKFLAKRLGVSERSIRRDLEEIEAEIPSAAVKDIHRMLMLRLRERLPEMKDHLLIRLTEFFLSKRTEAKIEGSQKFEIVVRDEVAADRVDAAQRPKADSPE